MKSKYIRAICLGAAGLLVISTAAINNHKQGEDVTARAAATASVIDESAETADAGVTAGIASVTAQHRHLPVMKTWQLFLIQIQNLQQQHRRK